MNKETERKRQKREHKKRNTAEKIGEQCMEQSSAHDASISFPQPTGLHKQMNLGELGESHPVASKVYLERRQKDKKI